MAKIDTMEGLVSKELHVYYILDTSGSMKGNPIATLNDAMRSTIEELKKIDATNADADLKIAVMEFNSEAKWATKNQDGKPVVVSMKDFYWSDLSAGGITELNLALDELKTNMSRTALQKSSIGNYIPVCIFMSDGAPTCKDVEWRSALAELNKNRWYQSAIKIAFALGEKADASVLTEVVGNSEAVISTSDLDDFARMIKLVSVASSLASSRSKIGETPTGGSVVEEIDRSKAPENPPIPGSEGSSVIYPPFPEPSSEPGDDPWD